MLRGKSFLCYNKTKPFKEKKKKLNSYVDLQVKHKDQFNCTSVRF